MAEFMMSFLAEELPFKERMAFANTWLFGNTIKKRFSAYPPANAVTRTTIAPTIIKGGHAENVLPATAEAVINLRLMPGDTLVDVYKQINELVGDETISVLPAHDEQLYGDHSWDPSPLSNVDSAQFHILLNLIRSTVPGSLAAPFLMTGATDARHYLQVSDNVFRFSPFVLTSEESESVHGVNERLSFENAARIVGFMIELIERMANLEVDTLEEFEELHEEDLEDLSAETRAIQELESPLPTRPMRKPIVDVVEPLEETDQIFDSDIESWEPLEDDDEPLEIKPMK